MQSQSIPTSTRQGVRAAVYCRVSTDKQERQGFSLDAQERICRDHCATQGWQVVVVEQEAESAKDFIDRPKLTRLRDLIRHGQADRLVVTEIDRLSREQAHQMIMIDELTRAGAELVCVTEPFENTPEGKFMLSARGFVSEVERIKKKEQAARARRQRADAGKLHNDGVDMYGYRRDKSSRTRVIYEPEAAVVRWMYEMIVCHGWSLRRLANDLNQRGVPSPGEGKVGYVTDDGTTPRVPRWGQSGLGRLLRRPEYRGESYAFQWKAGTDGNTQRPREDWIRLPDDRTPALVDAATWQRAQECIAAGKTRGAIGTRNERRPNLLRGLITCTCGRAMSPDREHGIKRVYRCCSKTLPGGACGARRAVADDLEPRVWSALARRLSDPALIEAEDDRWRARQPDALLESALESARRSLATIERQQQRAVRLHLLAGGDDDGDDGTAEVIGRELARLGRERAAAAAAVADLEARATAATVAAEQRAALWAYCQAVQGELDGLGFDERRAWLEAFDVRVVANGADWSGTARIRLGEVVVLGTPV